jgi:hypothetical protein
MFTGAVQEVRSSLPVDAAPKHSAPAEAVPPATSHAEAATSPSSLPSDSAKTMEQPAEAPDPASIMSQPSAGSSVYAANAAPATIVPVVATVDTGWQSALYTQQMAHQLAMAELRNQHLQEHQRLMQQMMDLMQRQLVK